MQRVYGLVDDELVHRIDEEAGESEVRRAQWIRIAIEAYIHRGGEQETIEAVNLRSEAVNLFTVSVNLEDQIQDCGEKAVNSMLRTLCVLIGTSKGLQYTIHKNGLKALLAESLFHRL